jgi:hypothetical protein
MRGTLSYASTPLPSKEGEETEEESALHPNDVKSTGNEVSVFAHSTAVPASEVRGDAVTSTMRQGVNNHMPEESIKTVHENTAPP